MVAERGGGRILALDVGERRIGVAIGDETATIASPLITIQRDSREFAAIARLAAEKRSDRIVVGLPTSLSGREGPQAAVVRAFAAALADALPPGVALDFWDERLTTAIAERTFAGSRTGRARRREQIDAIAAAVILQGFLDSRHERLQRATTPARGEPIAGARDRAGGADPADPA